MDYQEVYQKYQNAIKLRELSVDDNYMLLKEIFTKKILDSININTNSQLIPYIAGIKEVFSYVGQEVSRIDFYMEDLDRLISEK